MTKNEWTKWVSVVGRMLLAYALVFAQGAWAGQSQANKDKAASPQKAAAQQANEKQPAVAALTGSLPLNVLPGILARTATVGKWMILFYDNSGCIGTPYCIIYEGAISSIDVFPNLSVSAPQSGSYSGMFVLSGTATPSLAGAIAYVATANDTCPPGVAPSLSCASGRTLVTATQLNPALSFAAGQTIAITVVISLS